MSPRGTEKKARPSLKRLAHIYKKRILSGVKGFIKKNEKDTKAIRVTKTVLASCAIFFGSFLVAYVVGLLFLAQRPSLADPSPPVTQVTVGKTIGVSVNDYTSLSVRNGKILSIVFDEIVEASGRPTNDPESISPNELVVSNAGIVVSSNNFTGYNLTLELNSNTYASTTTGGAVTVPNAMVSAGTNKYIAPIAPGGTLDVVTGDGNWGFAFAAASSSVPTAYNPVPLNGSPVSFFGASPPTTSGESVFNLNFGIKVTMGLYGGRTYANHVLITASANPIGGS